jgi:hypothetical protein
MLARKASGHVEVYIWWLALRATSICVVKRPPKGAYLRKPTLDEFFGLGFAQSDMPLARKASHPAGRPNLQRVKWAPSGPLEGPTHFSENCGPFGAIKLYDRLNRRL